MDFTQVQRSMPSGRAKFTAQSVVTSEDWRIRSIDDLEQRVAKQDLSKKNKPSPCFGKRAEVFGYAFRSLVCQQQASGPMRKCRVWFEPRSYAASAVKPATRASCLTALTSQTPPWRIMRLSTGDQPEANIEQVANWQPRG